MTPWLTIIGIGEEGLSGLTPAARAALDAASHVAGGARHLAMLPADDRPRASWQWGLWDGLDQVLAWRGKPVAVLASGDPFCYGIASTLLKRLDGGEMTVIPAPSAFSLACSRLRWPLTDVATVTVHGRALDSINRHLYPGARLVILAQDGTTPAALARLLTEKGYGESTLTVLEHMGGPRENRLEGVARDWTQETCADLNTIGLHCVGAPNPLSHEGAGLPDDLYDHDGQITKSAVRAVTVAALAPRPGLLLWDVGAGSGSVAIEWLRLAGRAQAIAIETNPERVRRITENAQNLGVPYLEIVHGAAPGALSGLAGAPDRLFLGGGVSVPGLLPACWQRLAAGGRLVANGVTLEAEREMLSFREANGGALRRISIDEAEPVGRLTTLKPKAPVLQLVVDKP
ncbi:MAG: precorrin-6y C5,15-methyltransferase (decarboxylating) subunit CbiE [Magnetospiraceae bacterium]